MKTLIAAFLALASIALIVLSSRREAPVRKSSSAMAALRQTYIATNMSAPLDVPYLVTANGQQFQAKRLEGHWSVIFFGFTNCPLICPRTLAVLSDVCHQSESGVASGSTQPLFVSVDPERDTPARMSAYLRNFDPHIIGVTGSRAAIDSFSREIGAGYQPVGSSIDHSTSLFVVNPQGRLAGILLRPSQPARILADLAKLRQAYERGMAAN